MPEWARKGARRIPLEWGRRVSRSSTSPRSAATSAEPCMRNTTPDIQPSSRAHLATAADHAEPGLMPGTDSTLLIGGSCAAGRGPELDGGRAGEGAGKQEGGVRGEGSLEGSPARGELAKPSSEGREHVKAALLQLFAEAARLAEDSERAPETNPAPTAPNQEEEQRSTAAVARGRETPPRLAFARREAPEAAAADNSEGHSPGSNSPQPAELPGATAFVGPREKGSQFGKVDRLEPPNLEGTLGQLGDLHGGLPTESPVREAAGEHPPEWIPAVAVSSPASSPGLDTFPPEPSPVPEAFSSPFW